MARIKHKSGDSQSPTKTDRVKGPWALSMDAKVAKKIFQKYIQGALKDKTVVLVSHGLQVSSQYV